MKNSDFVHGLEKNDDGTTSQRPGKSFRDKAAEGRYSPPSSRPRVHFYIKQQREWLQPPPPPSLSLSLSSKENAKRSSSVCEKRLAGCKRIFATTYRPWQAKLISGEEIVKYFSISYKYVLLTISPSVMIWVPHALACLVLSELPYRSPSVSYPWDLHSG